MKMIHLARTLLRKNSWFVGAFQAALIFVCLVLAWFLEFDLTLPNRRLLLFAAGLLIATRMVAITGFGLLHGWWRYTGLRDTIDVGKAVLCGSALYYLVLRFVVHLDHFPRTVYVLEALLTAAALVGVRIFSRVLAESVRQDLASSRKVLLIGAGIAAQAVVRELCRPGSEYAPIGYVDDDRSKLGLKIEDIPVLGSVDQIPQLMSKYPIDEVLVAVPSASSRQMQRFVEICERSSVKFRTVPALRDVIAENVRLSDFRDVNVEDLLGRDPIEIDLQSVRSNICGKTVLVTGAAGSIGLELCRQILEHSPAALICVDSNENGIFHLEGELSSRHSKSIYHCHVGDAGDRKRMERIFQESSPDAIFHAAAYKHVPLMEDNVRAAVQNNVFGLLTLLEQAIDTGCESFILISSDKAVNPCNVMGATKRIGELIIANRPTNGMRCLSVRFGNVLGSNGSVVPLLQRQLRHGEPLTVTHPDVKRFFMTIREAVSLVLQGSVIGNKGDTLVLDMGEPISILDLVRTLITLSGKNESEVAIHFSGLRAGEKLVEELFYEDEQIGETSFSKIKRARGSERNWELLETQLRELEAVLYLNGSDTIRAKIKDILPEYSYVPESKISATDEESWLSAAATKIA
ncbi:MAG TPA: nucleoside-diphosphate sugar epimerase/dehydratase [Candidatus Sulfotelmatobacter sp.]|jgi:FlaA1/EpsC-like NDP-sugar epimerase